MKNYRPLLVSDLKLFLPGIELKGLRLNLHTPEADLSPHSHEHDQLLVYLQGQGEQQVGRHRLLARPGTVIFVPQGKRHSFHKQPARQPLCLVCDVVLSGERELYKVHSQLTAAAISRVKAEVSALFRLEDLDSESMRLQVAARILGVLDPVLKSVGWIRPSSRVSTGHAQGRTRMVERALSRPGAHDLSLEEVAKRVGYQRDHLNRILKAECGLTLGQLKARMRVKQAMLLLRQQLPASVVAERIGILDQNYFSRWFRQQTGMTPSAWKKDPQPFELYDN